MLSYAVVSKHLLSIEVVLRWPALVKSLQCVYFEAKSGDVERAEKWMEKMKAMAQFNIKRINFPSWLSFKKERASQYIGAWCSASFGIPRWSGGQSGTQRCKLLSDDWRMCKSWRCDSSPAMASTNEDFSPCIPLYTVPVGFPCSLKTFSFVGYVIQQ